jgi:hypothetical protein
MAVPSGEVMWQYARSYEYWIVNCNATGPMYTGERAVISRGFRVPSHCVQRNRGVPDYTLLHVRCELTFGRYTIITSAVSMISCMISQWVCFRSRIVISNFLQRIDGTVDFFYSIIFITYQLSGNFNKTILISDLMIKIRLRVSNYDTTDFFVSVW